jgi:hypothetical protein
LALAAAAAAQQVHINHTLTFLEVTAGTNTPVANPDGVLQPGEAARLQISVSFTPLVGGTVAYTPPPPPGIGVVAGLGDIASYLQGLNGAQGSWSSLALAPGWALGSLGTPTPNGAGLDFINAGQFQMLGQTANPQNPIPEIWRGVWQPANYFPRTVHWQEYRYFQEVDSLLLKYGVSPEGHPLYVAFLISNSAGLSAVDIPIVPAPTAAPILFVPWLMRRRRPYGSS